MTDTDKWKKPFFRSLPKEYKLFWFYILDDCDHAGLWHVDMEVADIRLGLRLSSQKAQELFADKIIVLDNGTKWFIPDFITFQYGEFNEANKMYKSIMPILLKYNLIPHISPIYGVKVKVKETVQVKEEERKQEFLKNEIWKQEFCMAKNISMFELEALQKSFIKDAELKGEFVDNYYRYFTNSFNKGSNNIIPKPKKEFVI